MGGETGGETGSGIHVDLDANTSTGEVSGGVTVNEEPILEAEVSPDAGVSGADLVAEEAGGETSLDAAVETDTVTTESATAASSDSLAVDVSAGTDTLGDDLAGTGNEDDPDNDADAEDTATDNADCTILDPLSIPSECL